MITIVKAAIKINGKIYKGYRHGNIMQKFLVDHPHTKVRSTNQGFITSTGRFVDRVTAAKIAFAAGQIPSGIYSLDSYQIFPKLFCI